MAPEEVVGPPSGAVVGLEGTQVVVARVVAGPVPPVGPPVSTQAIPPPETLPLEQGLAVPQVQSPVVTPAHVVQGVATGVGGGGEWTAESPGAGPALETTGVQAERVVPVEPLGQVRRVVAQASRPGEVVGAATGLLRSLVVLETGADKGIIGFRPGLHAPTSGLSALPVEVVGRERWAPRLEVEMVAGVVPLVLAPVEEARRLPVSSHEEEAPPTPSVEGVGLAAEVGGRQPAAGLRVVVGPRLPEVAVAEVVPDVQVEVGLPGVGGVGGLGEGLEEGRPAVVWGGAARLVGVVGLTETPVEALRVPLLPPEQGLVEDVASAPLRLAQVKEGGGVRQGPVEGPVLPSSPPVVPLERPPPSLAPGRVQTPRRPNVETRDGRRPLVAPLGFAAAAGVGGPVAPRP